MKKGLEQNTRLRWMLLFFFLTSQITILPIITQAETFPQMISALGSQPAISANGEVVAFDSPDPQSGGWNVFTYNRKTGSTELISVSLNGGYGNYQSQGPASISADGRFVAFLSIATDLTSDSLINTSHVFVRDRINGTTELVSDISQGDSVYCQSLPPSISADGRFVAYISVRYGFEQDDNRWNIFIYDRLEKVTEKINIALNGGSANGNSSNPSISADGRYIAFDSEASNLILNDTNGQTDVFVYDRSAKITKRVSVAPDGNQSNNFSSSPSISSDGQFIAFRSQAANLIPDDTNGKTDIFVYNTAFEHTQRVSLEIDGSQSTNEFDGPAISADGQFVTYYTMGDHIDPYAQSQVFVFDRVSGSTKQVSLTSDGNTGNGPSNFPSISADGSFIAFASTSSNFNGIPNDGIGVFITPNPLLESAPINKSPVANAGPHQAVKINALVTLDGTSSTDPDENYPLSYSWTLVSSPDDSTVSINNPTSVNPSFLADKHGTYVVSLIVTDSKGVTSFSSTVQISTTNTPPLADAGSDQSFLSIGVPITLDGSKSYDPDGGPLTYQWSISSKPEESDVSLSDPTAEKPTLNADYYGNYVFSLIVSDGLSSSNIDQVTVGFDNIKPVANAGINQSSIVGNTISIDGSQSSDANGDSLTFRWQLTTFPPGSQTVITSPENVTASFTADLPGQYVVSLIVSDGLLDSNPSNASAMVITYQNAATETLSDFVTIINNIPVDLFKNPNNKNALTNKINAALANIAMGNYADALNQLQNDVLGKIDGCAITEAPDKNDWITTESKNPTPAEIQSACSYQDQAYVIIMQAIAYIENIQ